MNDSLIWVIAMPLAGALLCVALPRMANAIGLTAVLASLAAALLMLGTVAGHGTLNYAIGGWAPGLGIGLRADGLSALLLLMTALVALAASIYASAYFKQASQRRHFWPLWLLLLQKMEKSCGKKVLV